MNVHKNVERHRYEATEGDQVVGYIDYRARGDAVELPHTVVEPGHEGKGVGSALARFALDDIARAGRKVMPTCSFVAGYIERHPQDAALVAS
jgi:predicted GNAT family acetyltransferase